jgi:hypothetical protein
VTLCRILAPGCWSQHVTVRLETYFSPTLHTYFRIHVSSMRRRVSGRITQSFRMTSVPPFSGRTHFLVFRRILVPSKRRELLAQWHGVTSWKTGSCATPLWEPESSLGLSGGVMWIPSGRGDYAQVYFRDGCYSNTCVCGLRSHKFTASAEADHMNCKLQRKLLWDHLSMPVSGGKMK